MKTKLSGHPPLDIALYIGRKKYSAELYISSINGYNGIGQVWTMT